jgi:hypothetical protein
MTCEPVRSVCAGRGRGHTAGAMHRAGAPGMRDMRLGGDSGHSHVPCPATQLREQERPRAGCSAADSAPAGVGVLLSREQIRSPWPAPCFVRLTWRLCASSRRRRPWRALQAPDPGQVQAAACCKAAKERACGTQGSHALTMMPPPDQGPVPLPPLQAVASYAHAHVYRLLIAPSYCGNIRPLR